MEHAAEIRAAGQFVKLSRTVEAYGIGVDAIFGVRKDGTTALQAIRFKANQFSARQAKEWLKEHGHRVKRFDAARKEVSDG